MEYLTECDLFFYFFWWSLGDERRMDRFPEEILLHIFYFLPASNLLQVSHVCKKWRRLVIPLYWKNPIFYQKVRLRELVGYPIKFLQTADIFVAAGISTEIVRMLEQMNLKRLVLNHSGQLSMRDLKNMEKLTCPVTVDSVMLREGGPQFEMVLKCFRKRKYAVNFPSDDFGGWSMDGIRQFLGLEIETISPENICFWYDSPGWGYGGEDFTELMINLNPSELVLIGGGCCGLQISRKNFQKLSSLNVTRVSTTPLLRPNFNIGDDWYEMYFPWTDFQLFKNLEVLILEEGGQISMKQLEKLGVVEILYPEQELLLRGGVVYIWKFLEYKEAVICEMSGRKDTYKIQETLHLHFKLNVVYSPEKTFNILNFRT